MACEYCRPTDTECPVCDEVDVTQAQPMPVVNDRPCVQDAVIADLRRSLGMQDEFGNELVDPRVIADIEARKAIGLAKYGTLLQPFNGRNPRVDAYQEALDLAQYLKQGLLEGDTTLAYVYEMTLGTLTWLRSKV